MAETIEQTWEQELLARGRAQGEARGEARGELRTCRETLRMQLEDRFGTLPLELVERIEAAELPGLLPALRQAVHIASLGELHL
jgi:predicted transposase YdaD